MSEKSENQKYYQGTGRRKRASARVRMMAGSGAITVNELPLDQYFTRLSDQRVVLSPLEAAGLRDTFDVTVHVIGGGVTGQSGATSMGIARAICHRDQELPETAPGVESQRLRPAMRRGGFLTRDPREKERKKPGLKRARKAPQYTKR
jgi:small subunit ribosomal protein S9